MALSSNKKKSLDDLKKLAESRGGKVLSSKYLNVKTKYLWECSQKHRWETSADSIFRGSWCPTCAGQKRYTTSEIRKICELKGGEFLSPEYINAHHKYEVRCREGHIFYPWGQSLIKGKWCKTCASNRLWKGKRSKKSKTDYIKAGLDVGLKFIGTEIPPRTTYKAEWQCLENGHIIHMTFSSIFNQKSHCYRCKGKGKITIKDCLELAKSRNGKLLSTKYEPYEKQEWLCSKGHRFSIAYSTAKHQNIWCSECSTGLGERICRYIFESIFNVPFKKVRPRWLINGDGNRLELDGYSEQLQLAFEHQGKQHYSIKYHRGSKKLIQNDVDKRRLCQQYGVTLIEIPEIPSIVDFDEAVNYIVNELKVRDFSIPKEAIFPLITPSLRWELTSKDEKKAILDRATTYVESKGAKLLSHAYMRRGKQYVFVFNILTIGGGNRSITQNKLYGDDLWSIERQDPLTGERFYPTHGKQKFATKDNSIRFNNLKKLGKL